MGRIGLNRDRGVRTTDVPYKQAYENYGALSSGLSNIQRANDRMIAGIKHVSDAMFKVSDDMKQKEIAQDNTNMQIEYFNRTQEALRNLSEKKIYNQQEYEKAFNDAMNSVDAGMDKWVKENTTWGESRDAFGLMKRNERAKNFAQAMGGFLAQKNKRDAEVLQHNYDTFVSNNDLKGVEAVLKSSKLAPEIQQVWLDKAKNQIVKNKLDSFTTQLRYATSTEQASKLIEEYEALYFDLNENQRIVFDVFSDARYEQLYNAESNAIEQQAKTIKAERVAIVNEKSEAGVIDITNSILKQAEKFGRLIDVNAEFDKKRNELSYLCDKYGFSEDEKKIVLDKFDNKVRQAKSEIPTQVQKVFYKRTTDILADAIENNNSDIDINVLSGGNTKYAEELLKQRQEYSRDKAWSISLIEKKNKGIELSEQEKEKLFLYNAKYNQALGDILDYDKSLDPYGKNLAGLIMKAQSFSNEEKQEFMKLLYNKAVKNEEAPAKWTKSDINAFEKEFKNFFKWAGNKDDSREYLQLRSRAISIAKLRGLSVQEAIIEMKNDEFYKRSKIKVNMGISKNAYGVK